MKGELLFLGTGSSMGIPVVGCECVVCRSALPANKRLRSSVLLLLDDKQIVIDAGPDFRQQALTHNISQIDGMILTHAHHDHTAGIDDLRGYCFKSHHPIPCLLSKETAQDIKKRFYYIFEDPDSGFKLNPKFQFHFLDGLQGACEFLGIHLRYFTYEQGGMNVNGFRFGSLAYISDIKHYDDSIFNYLDGIDTLILSSLRFTASHMHLTVDEAVEFSKRTSAKHTWLTHIAHELEHEKANAYLPANIRLAYDGLKIPLSGSTQ